MNASSPPLVSVVITCFNYEAYVAQAVNSVLAQTHSSVEIIVVNDGSTDRSAQVLAAFADRVQVIDQENTGQIVANNRAFAASRGEFVIFLDADDLLIPEAVAVAVRAWKPGCVKVQFELEIINAAGERLGRNFCNYGQPYGPDEVRREFETQGTYVWPVLSGNLYERGFLERLMPLTVRIFLDGFLNTIAPLYGTVETVATPLGFYRLHDSNQSYHGTDKQSIGTRFLKQVGLRQTELALLVEHASRVGFALPAGNLLDRDIVFVNYRLMLLKLGDSYPDSEKDSPFRLWRAGMAVLANRPLSLKMKISHAVWLSVLLCSPRPIAKRLILLRFHRAAYFQPIRRKLQALSGFRRAFDQGSNGVH